MNGPDLAEAVERVRALHQRGTAMHIKNVPDWCLHCGRKYPCPTVAALPPADKPPESEA